MLTRTRNDKRNRRTRVAATIRRGAAVCIEALKIVQRHRGWVSDDGLRDVADILDMTPDELDSVATFYNLIFRKPVGRHVILICDSVSCWIMGYERDPATYLKERLGIGLGETTADGRFTLLPDSLPGGLRPRAGHDDRRRSPQRLDPEMIDEILAHTRYERQVQEAGVWSALRSRCATNPIDSLWNTVA